MLALTDYTVLKTHDRTALPIISGLRDDYALVLLDHLLEAQRALRALEVFLLLI